MIRRIGDRFRDPGFRDGLHRRVTTVLLGAIGMMPAAIAGTSGQEKSPSDEETTNTWTELRDRLQGIHDALCEARRKEIEARKCLTYRQDDSLRAQQDHEASLQECRTLRDQWMQEFNAWDEKFTKRLFHEPIASIRSDIIRMSDMLAKQSEAVELLAGSSSGIPPDNPSLRTADIYIGMWAHRKGILGTIRASNPFEPLQSADSCNQIEAAKIIYRDRQSLTTEDLIQIIQRLTEGTFLNETAREWLIMAIQRPELEPLRPDPANGRKVPVWEDITWEVMQNLRGRLSAAVDQGLFPAEKMLAVLRPVVVSVLPSSSSSHELTVVAGAVREEQARMGTPVIPHRMLWETRPLFGGHSDVRDFFRDQDNLSRPAGSPRKRYLSPMAVSVTPFGPSAENLWAAYYLLSNEPGKEVLLGDVAHVLDLPPDSIRSWAHRETPPEYASARHYLRGHFHVVAEDNFLDRFHPAEPDQHITEIQSLYLEDADARLEAARILALHRAELNTRNILQVILRMTKGPPLEPLARDWLILAVNGSWNGISMEEAESIRRMVQASDLDPGYWESLMRPVYTAVILTPEERAFHLNAWRQSDDAKRLCLVKRAVEQLQAENRQPTPTAVAETLGIIPQDLTKLLRNRLHLGFAAFSIISDHVTENNLRTTLFSMRRSPNEPVSAQLLDGRLNKTIDGLCNWASHRTTVEKQAGQGAAYGVNQSGGWSFLNSLGIFGAAVHSPQPALEEWVLRCLDEQGLERSAGNLRLVREQAGWHQPLRTELLAHIAEHKIEHNDQDPTLAHLARTTGTREKTLKTLLDQYGISLGRPKTLMERLQEDPSIPGLLASYGGRKKIANELGTSPSYLSNVLKRLRETPKLIIGFVIALSFMHPHHAAAQITDHLFSLVHTGAPFHRITDSTLQLLGNGNLFHTVAAYYAPSQDGHLIETMVQQLRAANPSVNPFDPNSLRWGDLLKIPDSWFAAFAPSTVSAPPPAALTPGITTHLLWWIAAAVIIATAVITILIVRHVSRKREPAPQETGGPEQRREISPAPPLPVSPAQPLPEPPAHLARAVQILEETGFATVETSQKGILLWDKDFSWQILIHADGSLFLSRKDMPDAGTQLIGPAARLSGAELTENGDRLRVEFDGTSEDAVGDELIFRKPDAEIFREVLPRNEAVLRYSGFNRSTDEEGPLYRKWRWTIRVSGGGWKVSGKPEWPGTFISARELAGIKKINLRENEPLKLTGCPGNPEFTPIQLLLRHSGFRTQQDPIWPWVHPEGWLAADLQDNRGNPEILIAPGQNPLKSLRLKTTNLADLKIDEAQVNAYLTDGHSQTVSRDKFLNEVPDRPIVRVLRAGGFRQIEGDIYGYIQNGWEIRLPDSKRVQIAGLRSADPFLPADSIEQIYISDRNETLRGYETGQTLQVQPGDLVLRLRNDPKPIRVFHAERSTLVDAQALHAGVYGHTPLCLLNYGYLLAPFIWLWWRIPAVSRLKKTGGWPTDWRQACAEARDIGGQLWFKAMFVPLIELPLLPGLAWAMHVWLGANPVLAAMSGGLLAALAHLGREFIQYWPELQNEDSSPQEGEGSVSEGIQTRFLWRLLGAVLISLCAMPELYRFFGMAHPAYVLWLVPALLHAVWNLVWNWNSNGMESTPELSLGGGGQTGENREQDTGIPLPPPAAVPGAPAKDVASAMKSPSEASRAVIALTDEEIILYFGQDILSRCQKEGIRFYIRRLDRVNDQHFIDEWRPNYEPMFSDLNSLEFGVLAATEGRESLLGHATITLLIGERVGLQGLALEIGDIELFKRGDELPGLSDLLFDFLIKVSVESGKIDAGLWVQPITRGAESFVERRGLFFQSPSGIFQGLTQWALMMAYHTLELETAFNQNGDGKPMQVKGFDLIGLPIQILETSHEGSAGSYVPPSASGPGTPGTAHQYAVQAAA
jgi:hypothetical protein